MTKLSGMGLVLGALAGSAASCGERKLADETSVKTADTSTSASAENSAIERPTETKAGDTRTSDSSKESKTAGAAK